MGVEVTMEASALRYLQQTLQFMTLVLQADEPVTAFFHRQTMFNFIRNTAARLSQLSKALACVSAAVMADNGSDSQSYEREAQTLSSLLATFSAMGLAKQRGQSSYDLTLTIAVRDVWEVAIHATSPHDVVEMGEQLYKSFTTLHDTYLHDNTLSASFSSFVVATARELDKCALLGAIAWDMLRDYLLLVAQGQFLNTHDEPLSFAVCPTVFEAMNILIECTPFIGEYNSYIRRLETESIVDTSTIYCNIPLDMFSSRVLPKVPGAHAQCVAGSPNHKRCLEAFIPAAYPAGSLTSVFAQLSG